MATLSILEPIFEADFHGLFVWVPTGAFGAPGFLALAIAPVAVRLDLLVVLRVAQVGGHLRFQRPFHQGFRQLRSTPFSPVKSSGFL